MQIKIFMESPAGDVKEIVVTDPKKGLVPLMVAAPIRVLNCIS